MSDDLSLDLAPGAFSRFQGLLLTERTVQESLGQLTAAAQEVLHPVLGISITLLGPGAPATVGATNRLAEEADAVQYELSEGPCLHSALAAEPVLVQDTRRESRWQAWGARAAGHNIRSSLSVPLVHGGRSLGAVNAYAADPDRFGDGTRRLLSLIAAPAATLAAHLQPADSPNRSSADLRAALHSRDSVNIARGILMERMGVSEDSAMGLLLQLARRNEGTMYETARAVVEETVPEADAGGHAV